jgi:hypothetical protein
VSPATKSANVDHPREQNGNFKESDAIIGIQMVRIIHEEKASDQPDALTKRFMILPNVWMD